tara:strand:+ start:82 stop:1095 length:1014 start_codon:yes stop_codon:yes gene_type:complete
MGKFDFGGHFLSQDVGDEAARFSGKASRLAGAKKSGAGIGGLLGALALTVITGGAAGPLALAMAGGAGGLLGSKIGGATSGVSQDDLKGKFLQGTRGQFKKDLAKSEFSDVLKAATSAAMGGGKFGKFGAGFKDSFVAGAGEGVKGAIPGLQGGAPLVGGKVPSFGQKLLRGFKQGGKNVLGGGQFGLNEANMGAFGLDKMPGTPDFGPQLPDATNTVIPGVPANSNTMASDLVNLNTTPTTAIPDASSVKTNYLPAAPTPNQSWMTDHQALYQGPHGLKGEIPEGLQSFMGNIDDWEYKSGKDGLLSMYSPTYGTPSHMQQLWGTDEWNDWFPSVK